MDNHLPEIFLQRMESRLGKEFGDFIHALHEPAALSLRINRDKYKQQVKLEKVPWSEVGYYLEKRPLFVLDPLFHAGCYYVQEASSMLIEAAFTNLDLKNKKLKVLDLCGAPGGKATHLLSLLSQESLLITNETIRSRADILKENVIKWGSGNVIVTQSDPKYFSSFEGYFDVIVIDAPCSGEGLFRKDPTAINEWSEGNLQLCCERQERILHDVWPALKEDGFLIYSTCTYNPDENEYNINKLLKEDKAESVQFDFPEEWGITEVDFNNTFGYYCYPHKVRGEGFFLTVLKKKEATYSSSGKRKKDKAATIPGSVKKWVKSPQDLLMTGNEIISFPNAYYEDLEMLKSNLRIVSAGTNVATVAHKNINPEPALALSDELNQNEFNIADLSYKEALRYLKKETPEPEGLKIGFNLISFKGYPLGWAKKINENRVNNYFPKEWRIRMDLLENVEEVENELPLK